MPHRPIPSRLLDFAVKSTLATRKQTILLNISSMNAQKYIICQKSIHDFFKHQTRITHPQVAHVVNLRAAHAVHNVDHHRLRHVPQRPLRVISPQHRLVHEAECPPCSDHAKYRTRSAHRLPIKAAKWHFDSNTHVSHKVCRNKTETKNHSQQFACKALLSTN